MDEEEARQDGFGTAAERRAREAAERRACAAREAAAADAADLLWMRELEKRCTARAAKERGEEAVALREMSGRLFLAALEADYGDISERYLVAVPWALWCQTDGKEQCAPRLPDLDRVYFCVDVQGQLQVVCLTERADARDVVVA